MHYIFIKMEIKYDIPIEAIKREQLNKPRDNGNYICYIEKKEKNNFRNSIKKKNNQKTKNKKDDDKK